MSENHWWNFFHEKRGLETLQAGFEFHNFKPLLKSFIFKRTLQNTYNRILNKKVEHYRLDSHRLQSEVNMK